MAKTKILLKARLIVEDQGKILLLKQTKGQGGKYTLIGGTVEDNEFAKKALIRESFEESGIIIEKQDLHLVHTLHKKKNDATRIVLYFKASKWEGELTLGEPNKFKKVAWHPIDNLPKSMSDTVGHVLKHYRRGSRYSEMMVGVEVKSQG
ncbi:MAG: 8-oxo-dGTP diphosphatase [Saprospiraceae bacterium]|jgi:8-oxo-dGTP diphosphatase